MLLLIHVECAILATDGHLTVHFTFMLDKLGGIGLLGRVLPTWRFFTVHEELKDLIFLDESQIALKGTLDHTPEVHVLIIKVLEARIDHLCILWLNVCIGLRPFDALLGLFRVRCIVLSCLDKIKTWHLKATKASWLVRSCDSFRRCWSGCCLVDRRGEFQQIADSRSFFFIGQCNDACLFLFLLGWRIRRC